MNAQTWSLSKQIHNFRPQDSLFDRFDLAKSHPVRTPIELRASDCVLCRTCVKGHNTVYTDLNCLSPWLCHIQSD